MLLLLLSGIALATADCPPGYSLEPNTDKCYRVYTTAASFFDAQYSCTQDGANLASITNSFENSYVANILPMSSFGYYFLGLTRLVNPNKWIWLDDTPVYYTNFYPNQNYNESCVSFSTLNNAWFITSCSNYLGYVCSTTASNCPTCPYCNGTCSARCEQGWTYFDQTHSCYRSLKNAAWYNAEESCQAAGGHLTSIHSKEENAFVMQISQSGIYAYDSGQPLVGLKRLQSGVWAWSDGTALNYTNWHPNYPASVPYNCAYVFSDDSTTNGGWLSYWGNGPCTDSHRAYVCKKPAH